MTDNHSHHPIPEFSAGRTRGSLFGPPLTTWLRTLLWVMAVLMLWRFLYLAVYGKEYTGLSVWEFSRVLLVGLRFDLATALLTITLPCLLIWWPGSARWRRRLAQIASWLSGAALVIAVAFLWGDLLFYREAGRHLTTEPAQALHDTGSMLRSIVIEYPLHLIGFAVLAWLLMRLVRRQFRPLLVSTAHPRRWWTYPAPFIVMGGVTFIGVRGGIQKEPLKSTDAVLSESYVAGNLALNGWYSFLSTTFLESRADVSPVSDREIFAATRRIIGGPPDEFVSSGYPLLRRSHSTASIAAPGEKLNVVLIVVESLNATYLPAFGGTTAVMPFLDSLAREGVAFTNCMSVGNRSFRSVCAILASVPDLVGNPYAITLALPNLRGLGETLTEQGYRVRFMHAASPGSMGIMAICHMAGYGEFVSSADFPKSASDGSWGVWDHIALGRMSREMDELPEPFHYGMFTLSTHAPWRIPNGFPEPFQPPAPDAAMNNTYAYLDHALREFFGHEAARGRFQRTLYVLVGDHTSHASEEERFRVGCIFFAPGRLAPRTDNRLMSQLDILPTILDLLGIETWHASFGRSLMSPDTSLRYAVMTQSNLIEWRRDSRILIGTVDRNVLLFNPESPGGTRDNLLPSEPEVAARLRGEMDVFYQAAERMIRTNRIYPRLLPAMMSAASRSLHTP